MSRHHVIITGTGRNGTTFLMQLYTALGLPTGFPSPSAAIYAHCNAGMEWDIRRNDAPYIVKDPQLCDLLPAILDQSDIVIDHAVIPIRHLYSAAESRRDVSRRTDARLFPPTQGIPGGLWHTKAPQHQELILALQLYKILFTLAERDIPITLLHFPRFIHDPEYLYRKLEHTLQHIEFERFAWVFGQIAQPALVHDFAPANAGAIRN